MNPGLANWHFFCADCHLEKSTLAPRINELHSIDEAQRAAALQDLRASNFTRLLDWLQQRCAGHLPQRPALLEVGCAHGWFLQKAQEKYQAEGIEPDHAIARQAQAKGLAVRTGFFPDALQENERFHIIVFNDVLEHIPDVGQVLRCCHQHLHEGGYIVVNAPDSEGLFYRLSRTLARLKQPGAFERMWQLGLPSPHLYYFNTATLQKLAAANGFLMEDRTPLPSISLRGLRERIQYTQAHARVKSLLLYHAIRAAYPWIRTGRPDIHAWLLKKA